MSLIDAALSRSRTVLSLLLFILVAGFVAYQAIPKEADPDINIPIVYVSMHHEGISPEDAERLLVRPMEKELRSIEGVKELRSTAFQGGANVLLEFEAGFDADAAVTDVRESVDLAKPELPGDTDEPEVHEVNLSLFPVLNVTLSGDVPERTLLRLARDLKDEVEGIPEVLEAKIVGDRDESVELVIDPVLLDSYEIEGELLLCHGFCELGSQPLDEALGEINAFLTANPHEVMILFFQDAVGSEAMSQAIEESGLGSLVYTHTEGQDFPTLGDLIEQNTRVIIASESHGPPPPWYHYGWDLFFDTPYSFKSVEEFSCSLNRGQSGNPLFLLNHWLADSVGLPSKKAATTANSFDVLYERAKSCWDEHDHIPNLVAVDFYATGDLMAVVNALNGVLSEEKSTSTE